MSDSTKEPSVFDRVPDRPALRLGQLRGVRRGPLLVRFAAGALTSIAAGAVTLALGAHVGGVLLAFPSILAASITLIAQQEDRKQAREDARGAVLGAVAMAAFAAVCVITLTALPGGLALLLASGTWLSVALLGYAIFWL